MGSERGASVHVDSLIIKVSFCLSMPKIVFTHSLASALIEASWNVYGFSDQILNHLHLPEPSSETQQKSKMHHSPNPLVAF